MANADALFGMGVGGATSSPSTPSMRVAYSSDGTAVYKSVPPGSSPPPSYHHQPSPASTGGGSEVHVAPHGLNMNVVIGGGPDLQQQQQQPPSMMMMMKKKRGRPRKYEGAGGGGGGPTDGTMPLSLMPAATSAPRPATPASAPPPILDASGGGGGAFSPPSGGGGGSGAGSEASFKKRGRPPGSMNKKKPDHHQPIHAQPLGSAGVGFTPHVISVQAGEDVSAKIMTFSQNGPRAVCILSANGSISNVTLRQAATSGGTATYEGRFEILSLCGSFLLMEVGGQRSRTGGLSVSLAGPDGRVLGGCVAGLLTAAAPVQVIVGSFIPDGRKETKPPQIHAEQPNNNQFSSPPIPMPMPMSMSMPSMLFSTSGGGGGGNYGGPTGGGNYGGPTGGVSSGSPSQGGSLSESSGGEGSSPRPPNHNTVGNNNNHNNSNPQGMLGMPWR